MIWMLFVFVFNQTNTNNIQIIFGIKYIVNQGKDKAKTTSHLNLTTAPSTRQVYNKE